MELVFPYVKDCREIPTCNG